MAPQFRSLTQSRIEFPVSHPFSTQDSAECSASVRSNTRTERAHQRLSHSPHTGYRGTLGWLPNGERMTWVQRLAERWLLAPLRDQLRGQIDGVRIEALGRIVELKRTLTEELERQAELHAERLRMLEQGVTADILRCESDPVTHRELAVKVRRRFNV
jgi:hypothetical protein